MCGREGGREGGKGRTFEDVEHARHLAEDQHPVSLLLQLLQELICSSSCSSSGSSGGGDNVDTKMGKKKESQKEVGFDLASLFLRVPTARSLPPSLPPSLSLFFPPSLLT